MADNEFFYPGDKIPLVVGASVAVRTPMVVGKIPVMTLTATGATGTTTATCLLEGVVKVSVHGYAAAANAAIAVGDIIYYDATELNVDSTNGVRWGYALEAVTSGSTTVIKVKIGY